MGNTWEVHVYTKDVLGYAYQEFWRGQGFFAMLRAARRAKRTGAGCIKIEWRP